MSATIADPLSGKANSVQAFIDFVYDLCHTVTDMPNLDMPSRGKVTILNAIVQIESELHIDEASRKSFAASLVRRLAGVMPARMSTEFNARAKVVLPELGLDISILPGHQVKAPARPVAQPGKVIKFPRVEAA